MQKLKYVSIVNQEHTKINKEVASAKHVNRGNEVTQLVWMQSPNAFNVKREDSQVLVGPYIVHRVPKVSSIQNIVLYRSGVFKTQQLQRQSVFEQYIHQSK